MSTLLPGIFGAAVAGGIVLAVLGVRGTAPRSSARTVRHWLTAGRTRVVHRVKPGGAVAAAMAGIVVWWLTDWPVAGLAVTAGLIAVPRMLAQPGNRDLIAQLDALAEWTRRISDILASGIGGLEQAIAASAHSAPAPLAEAVTALTVRMRTRGLEPALWAFARDIDHAAVHRIVASLILRTRAGGRGLVDILSELADSLRAETAMRRQVEADRAKARTSARALIGIVLVVTVALVVFTFDYLSPFETVEGQLWLTVVLGIFIGGLAWLALLTRPRREPGFLFDRTHRSAGLMRDEMGVPAR